MARNIAPRYCVVERPGTLGYQARELFRDMRSPAVSLFMQLNAAHAPTTLCKVAILVLIISCNLVQLDVI